MAMDPNKSNNSSGENNPNRQLTPGASSRAARLSPPIAGGLSFLLFSRDLPMFHRRFEDTFRRCFREVLQEKLPYINLPLRPLPDPSIQTRYQLQFINKVKNTTFTTDLVRDENGNPIKVEIYDTYTQSIISPDCFLSSVKVRLMVLKAEFWKNKGVNWSRSEFIKSMPREREGKGPILTGPDLIIRLENGVGTFGNIVFNDNSKWTESGFRLGVMVEGEGEEGYLNGERVREGVSESFRVKDRRGKASQKPDRLELKHGVQCLKKVGKDRASLLQSNNIKTVEDFLCGYYNNEPALREILCIKSESDKRWKSMVKHAMQCADKFHTKYNALNNSCQPPQALVHTPGRTMPLQTNCGPCVGSGSSVPNPCENNLLTPDTLVQNAGPMQRTISGVLQMEVSSNSDLLDNLLAIGESTPNSNFQSPSRSNSFDAGSCEALVQQFKASMSNSVSVGPLSPRRKAKIKILLKLIPFLVGPRSRARIVPQQALVHPMGRNMSLCINGGPRVVGSGSLEPNPFENDKIEGDMPAFYEQLPAICDISSMNLSNENISTASGEHIVETQHPLFHETNHANVESGNILNGDSLQRTNGGGFPQLEFSNGLIPMEDLYAADAESTPNYSMQFPSGFDDFDAGIGLCFTGSMSNSVYGGPLTPRSNRKIKAILRSVAFLAVPRKRARIAPPANQTTVLAI